MAMHSQSQGPKIWQDLDQAALDAAYDQTVYAPNHADVIGRMGRNSAMLAQHLPPPQTHLYGDTPIERLYYYPPENAGCPVHVHIHGGGWRQYPAKGFLFPAEMFVRAGIGFAILDFVSVEETGGDLRPMCEQVRKGLAWIARNASRLGGDGRRLHLSGFSSGAHLAGVALTADWSSLGFAGIPYKSAAVISGMYDLHPVRLSKRSEYVTFTDEIEEELSAQRHVDRIDVPVLLAYGARETPEFQRQTRDFAQALQGAGKSVDLIVCEGYNHFEMMEMLGQPYSPVGRAVLALNSRV